jgi:hypothetical protein
VCAFALVDGALVAQPGNGIGLLFYAAENFEDFVMRLEFLLPHPRGLGNDNSGVFVRFRHPRQPVPDRNNPAITYPYGNQAFVGVDTGFEIQIDEEARGVTRFGEPDGFPTIGRAQSTRSRASAPTLVSSSTRTLSSSRRAPGTCTRSKWSDRHTRCG